MVASNKKNEKIERTSIIYLDVTPFHLSLNNGIKIFIKKAQNTKNLTFLIYTYKNNLIHI